VRHKRGEKVLLDHVTFPIPEKCLLGIIGPSGAGKSTLLGALTGMRPADTGTVLYDNRDLYQNYSELRYRIGLVPQENGLHAQLTARCALQYAAELRFAADTLSAERDRRVDDVISELGLTAHANTPVSRLSGGQRKRADVAQELLTRPSLLCLDEPTSGLDPGLDTRVMGWLRDRGYLAFLVLPVILGALIRFFPSKDGLAGPPYSNDTAQALLAVVVACACLTGAGPPIQCGLTPQRPGYATWVTRSGWR
jgi:ABC-type multidrug transport system ATPase subunit